MILYHNASNSIWVEAMKNRTKGEIIAAQEQALKRIKQHGVTLTKQVLDNKTSAAYKEAIKESGMTYQLVPRGEDNTNMERLLYSSA